MERVDPSTGEIIKATYTVSQFHLEMTINKMARAESLTALVALKDKCKSVGLIKSHEKRLRDEYEYHYRRLKKQEKEDAEKDGNR